MNFKGIYQLLKKIYQLPRQVSGQERFKQKNIGDLSGREKFFLDLSAPEKYFWDFSAPE
jgi:hypothetical protein